MLKDLNAAADAAGEKVRAGMAEAVAAAEASYERLSAQVEASRAVAERATRTGDPGGRAPQGPRRGARAWAARARRSTEFVSERIRQDLATQAELLGCRNLDEVGAVQTRFFRTAVDQYSEGAARWRSSAPR